MNDTAPSLATAAAAPPATGPLARLLAEIGARTGVPFRIVWADGSAYWNSDTDPAFTLTFRSRRAEARVLGYGHIGLLEAYFEGAIDIEGNLAAALHAGLAAGFDARPNPLVTARNRWHEFRYSNRSIAQAKANARFHYGIGEAFYRYWLDRVGMMYTCAYWKEGTQTLEEAQVNKMDHVCRKVQLQHGETFVDVGCGWGGLLFHAHERYGALGTGINTTTEQVNELAAEIARRGLTEKIKLIECDFREIPGQYDKLLSIGTLEHAGRDQLFDVVKAHADAMKPGALGVIHFIGHFGRYETEFFIRNYIFPGGWIPSLAEAIEAMERVGLEVLDVENLRRHYALTLDAWAERFDASWEKIQALDPVRFDERFRRIWRTYLWSCAEMFRSRNGRTHLFQVLVSKGNIGSNYPMSRGFLYRDSH
ncbi:MAG TPA: cyclopropane-fatty-acyl-phospholipid synthase family protein [Casimicrobiaceae bacterium]|jgi:cyclopropane-fatty-acyl-phospholipid synthase|nr:cyclopropane-fatty-acyl-phospholipid synthase family protein [Casimicrobiaceae bacterium]